MKFLAVVSLLFVLVNPNPARADLGPSPTPINSLESLDNRPFMERFPELTKFIHKEEASNLYFGFGVSPITLVNGKFGFAASIFQLHYLKDKWDTELLNLSFGKAFGDALGKEDFFLLRMSPKYKIYKNISIGPLIGIEFVHFPDVKAALTKGGLFSQQFDYSTFGYFYGGAISQTFDIGTTGTNAIRVSAIYYKERYSVEETNNGWTYYFQQNSLNIDKSPIAPSSMFMLEISYLY
ncbi:MAG: hypothetical protein JST80_11375 [Bdellovibrionales bacterium]|nr:hypothetical protein [Bdellovibrionales bacterium]